jgi:hypothetical protein
MQAFSKYSTVSGALSYADVLRKTPTPTFDGAGTTFTKARPNAKVSDLFSKLSISSDVVQKPEPIRLVTTHPSLEGSTAPTASSPKASATAVELSAVPLFRSISSELAQEISQGLMSPLFDPSLLGLSPTLGKRTAMPSPDSSPRASPDQSLLTSMREATASPKERHIPTSQFRAISPSIRALQQKSLRVKQRLDSYKKQFPCFEKGNFLRTPCTFPNLKVDQKFLKTEFGTKTLAATDCYLKGKGIKLTPQKYIIGKKFYDGTCAGQSYSLMIAFMKMQKREMGKTLLGLLKHEHILYFQVLESLMGTKREEIAGPDGKKTTIFSPNKTIKKIALDELENSAQLKLTENLSFDLKETNAFKEMRQAISQSKSTTLEIGMYSESPGDGHSAIGLFGDGSYYYDAQAGLLSYTNKDDFIHDLFKLFEKRQTEKNPLRYIVIEGFTPVKKEEHKAT